MTISSHVKKNMKKSSGSLQDLCYDSIVSSIQTAPPLLQEIIMGETTERMKNKMIVEAYDSAREKAIHDVCEELPSLITEIMQNIIMAMSEDGRNRRSFRDEHHKSSHPDILECAIKISEDVVQTMESHYIYRAFGLPRDNREYDSDIEYDSDKSSENSHQQFYSDPDVSDMDD